MHTYYREKKYYCGKSREYLESYIYPVYPVPGSRKKKTKPTSEVQELLNQHYAENKLTRLLNHNFTSNDIEVHLTYFDNPDCDEQAKKDIQNFLRRVRRLRRKNGIEELKYISVTERSGKGRYHHHVTMNAGIDRDILENLWGKGYANSKRLQFDNSGLVGLAKYIVKSPVFAKRWNASRNIKEPEPKINNTRITKRKAEQLAKDTDYSLAFEQLYPGYHLAEAYAVNNDVNGGIYLCVRMFKNQKYGMKSRGDKCG